MSHYVEVGAILFQRSLNHSLILEVDIGHGAMDHWIIGS